MLRTAGQTAGGMGQLCSPQSYGTIRYRTMLASGTEDNTHGTVVALGSSLLREERILIVDHGLMV